MSQINIQALFKKSLRPASVASAALSSLGLMLGGCGGGGSSSSSSSSDNQLQTQIQAAQATANNTDPKSSCGAISQNKAADGSTEAAGVDDGFYWEIGTAKGIASDPVSGLSAAGSVHPATAPGTSYARGDAMQIASASKWMYGAYVAEKLAVAASGQWTLPQAAVPFLNFTSGYDNLVDATCFLKTTVGACLSASSNDTVTVADVGRFYYNSGHLEVLEGDGAPALTGLMNGASHTSADLSNELMSAFSARGVNVQLSFGIPLLAGGITTSAGDYATFLQGMLRTNSPLLMQYFLRPTASDPYAVCTDPTSSSCVNAQGQPLAVYAPVPAGTEWHYSITHWIEDDPATGDGSYSSPGKYGFYPWIDASKTYYGIVARHDTNSSWTDATQAPYYKSAICGAAIRKAFMTGVVQN